MPPLPTCSGPTSNCGFTSSSMSPSGASSGGSCGSTSVSEMKLTSATIRSKSACGSGAWSRSRALTPSMQVTRASSRKPRVQLIVADIDADHACGAGLQQAIGEAAGALADVEAGACRARRAACAPARRRA